MKKIKVVLFDSKGNSTLIMNLTLKVAIEAKTHKERVKAVTKLLTVRGHKKNFYAEWKDEHGYDEGILR